MKNPFMVKEWKVSGVVLILWILFTSGFVILSFISSLQGRFYQAGVRDAQMMVQKQIIAQIIDLSLKTCEKPLVLDYKNADGKTISESLINMRCLQAPSQENSKLEIENKKAQLEFSENEK